VTQYAQPQAQLRSTLRGKPDDEINPSTVTQNVQFRLPPVLIRPEPKAVQIGGYTRVLSLWINHALRSASDTKAAGAAAPRVRA